MHLMRAGAVADRAALLPPSRRLLSPRHLLRRGPGAPPAPQCCVWGVMFCRAVSYYFRRLPCADTYSLLSGLVAVDGASAIDAVVYR